MQGKKRVLIILAHPNTDKSFNHRLVKKAEEILLSQGHFVRIVDLYKIHFNPVGGPDDFNELNSKESFDYQYSNEKKKGQNFTQELQEQMENVKWADVLFFQFPFYWFSVPAILKGWIDRVFSYYFAYGGNQSFKGKKWITSVTTGGPEDMYKKGGYSGISIEEHLLHFHSQTSKLVQAEALPLYISYGVNFMAPEKKDEAVEEFAKYMKKYF